MSPTRTGPDLLSSLTTGWNDALQQWWDQSQAALDPWMQAWDTISPPVGGPTLRMPSRHHRDHRHHEPCGCESEHDCRCHDSHRHDHDHGRHDEHRDSHEREHGHGPADEHGHGHVHARCGCENRCRCCIPDADVVLHARSGELRVIPFLLRNPWRREREVTVAVGPWHVCDGGRLEVRSVFDVSESLTLQPCEKRVVRLRLRVQGICDDGQGTNDGPKVDPAEGPNVGTKDDPALGTNVGTKDDPKNERQLGCDVECCTSAYADVRFEGCARPQRIAVVVHPASCDAVELPCDCGCC